MLILVRLSTDAFGLRLVWLCLWTFPSYWLTSSKGKKGCKPFKINREVSELHTFLKQTSLIDLGYHGPNYNWCNNYLDLAQVWESLDMAFVSNTWIDLFLESYLNHLTKYASPPAIYNWENA